MFISPITAVDSGWVTGIRDTDTQIQPNAIDFTLDHLYTINKSPFFHVSERMKEMRGGAPLEAQHDPRHNEDFWRLEVGVYDGMSDIYVDVPDGVAAYLIIRSTFNRNGLFITSGLYDSGFKGHIGFALHNRAGLSFIAPGTRVGQLIFVESQNALMYSGGYNHELGTHHSE